MLASLRSTCCIQANASLDFSYQYAAQFEVLLSKLEGVAHLHVFRSAKSDLTTTLGATLQFDGDTSASIATHQDELETSVVAAAVVLQHPKGLPCRLRLMQHPARRASM
jgi:hypothetical protein